MPEQEPDFENLSVDQLFKKALLIGTIAASAAVATGLTVAHKRRKKTAILDLPVDEIDKTTE